MKSTVSIFTIWLFTLILLSLYSCTHRTEAPDGTSGKGDSDSKVDSTILVTVSGKEFIVIEDRSLGASVSIVSIKMAQFTEVNRALASDTIDPIEKLFLADLDQNGFEELYITTRGAGSGSFSNIYGYASNRDKSVSQVYVPEVTVHNSQPGSFFHGFMGHNNFSLEEGVLINSFPVYMEGDNNSNPSGGVRRVKYFLRAGEASWILEPIRMEAH